MPLSKLKQAEYQRERRVRVKAEKQPSVPVYDPRIHKAGDKVMVRPQYGRSKKLIEVTIPKLDIDGNPIPED